MTSSSRIDAETATPPARPAWAQFELLVSHLTDGVTVQDATGRLVYANAAGARMSGYHSPQELMSAPVGDYTLKFEVMTPNGEPLPLAELPGRRAIVSGQAAAVLRVRQRETGAEHWSDVRSFAVRDRADGTQFVVNVIRDVTESWRYERLLEEQANALTEQTQRLEAQAEELEEQTVEAHALADQLEHSNDELARLLRAEGVARRREEFLSQATALLGASLDYEKTLKRVATLVVPELADWCSVELRDARTGVVRQLAVAHVDPAKVRWARELHDKFPANMDAAVGLPQVLRTGEAELYASISDLMLVQSARSEEELRMLREVGLKSAMIVPLPVGGRTGGVITMVAAESGKHYTTTDLAFAKELGRRAGAAIERSQLHQEALTAYADAERAYERANEHSRWLSRLQQLTMALSRSLVPDEAVAVALGLGRQLFDADRAVVWLLDDARATLRQAGQQGFQEAVHARLVELPMEAKMPPVEAVRRGEPVLIGDLTSIVDAFPDASDAIRTSAVQAIASIPIRVSGEVIGAFTYSYGASRAFSENYVSAARTFGKELGQALERTKVRAALEEARKVAHAASEAKSDFLATMSHELRTPINAILGFTALLDLGVSSGETVRQAEYVGRIRKSTEHLLELINDVLDWSRVEAGRLAVTSDEASAKDVIDDVLNVVRNQAIARSLTLNSECVEGATYVGDPLRVRQILLNLLSNAMKFTEAGGRVRLECSAADAMTRFAVEDSGIGIAPEELEMIFEPFVQAEHGYTRTHGGTGLGLTISRTLARTMGGDVTVESRPGEGSTFSLLLPSRIREVKQESAHGGNT